MTESQMTTLLECTFSRAEFAVRTGLLRNFLEWVFFTAHEGAATAELVERYEAEMHTTVRDAAFLRALPKTFWDGWTQENFYEQLETLDDAVSRLPVLTLTVAVPFESAQVDAVGAWARRSVDPKLLVECNTDPALGAGCQVVWRNHLHDYSFAERLSEKRSLLAARIVVAPNAAA